MIKCVTAILLSFVFTSCEIITIGTPNAPKKEVINVNQQSPLGAVYLFKTELDSNNVPAAAQILADSSGNLLLAIEKYERYFDVDRMKRKIGQKLITKIVRDSLAENDYRYNVEFDYLTNVTFTTSKIRDEWYITNYKD